MTAPRTAARTAAVLGAAAALTMAGAGAAMAATTSHEVTGEKLAVTFTKEGALDLAVCFAAVAPTASAPALIKQVNGAAGGDLGDIVALISGKTAVTVLKTKELFPNAIPSVAVRSQTVYATLEPNVYTLVSKCTGSDPVINPGVIVGDPATAIQGSIGTLSSDGDALGVLSSALGGEGESGSPLSGLLGGTGSGAGTETE
ncbi:hypothetical protein [Dietzia sp. UBA5065]|jgi:hypothetical protein|uniref:hypothetical protein n=1 Tax=Dietzia sp. UBA5065 TaxID=1946422 RepID=UPI0025C433CD|nr:hypothetical protein [Dietzia sp. UBA5065]